MLLLACLTEVFSGLLLFSVLHNIISEFDGMEGIVASRRYARRWGDAARVFCGG